MVVVEKPEGPQGLDEKVSASWLILQRLDDLKGPIADVKTELGDFREATDRRFDAVDRRFDAVDRRFEAVDRRFEALEHRWTWALGLVLVMALGLLAKLLLPGA